MKARNVIVLTFALCISCVLLFSCKKEKNENPATPMVDESGQSSADNRSAQGENETAVNDINNVVGENARLHGRGGNSAAGFQGITGTICGLTVDTNGAYLGTIKLNYNGTTCNNRTRTGTIMLTVQDYTNGKRWKHVGCIIKVDYQQYKITRASDGKYIQLDGTQYLTNVSGGSWLELLLKSQTSLVTTVTGTNLKATFEDGKAATYNINRRFTYTFPNDIITFQGEGIGASAGLSGLENYGTTRNGEPFTSEVVTPIVWNLTCGPWAPVQGVLNIKVVGKGFDLICRFSVDINGNPVTANPNHCPYGWKLEWNANGQLGSKIFGYI